MLTFFWLLLELFILCSSEHRLKLSSRAKLDLVASDIACGKLCFSFCSCARYTHLKRSKVSKSYDLPFWEMLDEELVEIIEYCEHIRVRDCRSSTCDFLCQSFKADFSISFCWGVEFCRFARFENVFPLNDVVLDCHDTSWLRIKTI